MIEYSGKLSIEAATALAQANYNHKTHEEIITLKQRIADLEAKQNDLLSLIYNSAIGSLAMGFSVDISHIASEAYGITGISAEQLSQQPASGGE